MYLFFCRSTTAEGHFTVDSDLQWKHGGCGSPWPTSRLLPCGSTLQEVVALPVLVLCTEQPDKCIHHLQEEQPVCTLVQENAGPSSLPPCCLRWAGQGQHSHKEADPDARKPGSLTGRAVSDPSEHPIVRMLGRKKNCMQCQSSGHRTPKGRGIESVYGCTTCRVHLCKGHCFAHFHLKLLQWSVLWAVICSLCMCDRLHKVPLWSMTVCYLALKGGHFWLWILFVLLFFSENQKQLMDIQDKCIWIQGKINSMLKHLFAICYWFLKLNTWIIWQYMDHLT